MTIICVSGNWKGNKYSASFAFIKSNYLLHKIWIIQSTINIKKGIKDVIIGL